VNSISPDPDHATSAPQNITMYGADWCGDCLRAQAVFAERNIEYDYIDLVEHESGTDVVLVRNNNVQKIPVIIFPDNTHLTEPTNAELEEKLVALGTSPEATGGGEAGEGSEYELIENRDEGRFELHHGDMILSIASFFEREGGIVAIPHVATDPQFRGQGNAGRLMDGVLETLRSSGRKVVPQCPFAVHHINENPQYQDLLA